MEPYDFYNVLNNLNNISQENDDQEICCICQDVLNNGEQTYELPECNHMFHTNCIVTWFRSNQQKCPFCANIGTNGKKENLEINQWGSWSGYNNAKKLMDTYQYKCITKILTKKDCPKDLKSLEKKITNNIKKYLEIKKEYAQFKKTTKNTMSYKDACDESSKRMRIQRNLGIKIYRYVKDFMNYPIIPLIIPFKN